MNAEKLSITLPADMAQMVRRRVASGAYASNSEVIREALRDMLERERRLDEVRARIDAAIHDPVRHTPQEVRDRLDRLHRRTSRAGD